MGRKPQCMIAEPAKLELPPFLVERAVAAALEEDLGQAGDITTEAIVPEHAEVDAVIAARQPGIVAGLDAALLAFELVDPALHIARICGDGVRVSRGA